MCVCAVLVLQGDTVYAGLGLATGLRLQRQASRQMQPTAETGVKRHVRCNLLQRPELNVTSDAACCRDSRRASRQMQPATQTGVELYVRCSLLQRQASCVTSDVACCTNIYTGCCTVWSYKLYILCYQ